MRTSAPILRSQPLAVALRLLSGLAVLSASTAPLSGCATMGLKSAVDVSVSIKKGTPQRALVYVDEEFIGTLDYVAKKGLRLTEGEHRVSVEKNGYYPFDKIVISDRQPIALEVELLRLPD